MPLPCMSYVRYFVPELCLDFAESERGKFRYFPGLPTACLSILPRRHHLLISPQTILILSYCLLQLFENSITWHVSPITTAPTLLHELLIYFRPIVLDHLESERSAAATTSAVFRYDAF